MPVHPRRLLVPSLPVALLLAATPVAAQIGVGTWVRTETPGTPGKLTMTVAACCGNGRRLVYHLDMNGTPATMTVESKFDGTEAPVMMNGQPTTETMAISWVDERHTSTVLTMNGKPFGTAKSTLSADGKTLTVENDYSTSIGGQQAGKSTETWVRQ